MPATSTTPSRTAAISEPFKRAGAADHDHQQEVDQVLEREGRIQPQHVDRERAAQARQPRPQREGDAEQQADVDADTGRRRLIVDRGAQLRAEPRPREQQTDGGRHRHDQRDQEQPVRSQIDPKHGDLPVKEGGQLHRLLRRSPHPGGGGPGHERKTDGEQHLIEVAAAVEASVQHRLQRRADQPDDEEDHGQREQEGHPRTPGQLDAEEAAHHRERRRAPG